MPVGLGIESTAHTIGIGIVRDGKIIANEKNSYSTEKGGIVPLEAGRHHEKYFDNVVETVMKKNNLKFSELDFISVANAPGLAPCLLVGMKKTKELCKKFNIPLVPVNHCIAHLEIGKLTNAKDPVMLYTSGANTQIIAYSSGKYRVFGETLDIGVGNFIDNFARFLGMGFPGGPVIEEFAKKGKNYIELPYTVKGMDIALSGILTNLKNKIESEKYSKEDLSYSMQETVFAMLVETAERALAYTGKNELLLGGGVACNSRLQEMCKIMCEERGAKFFVPEKSLLVDNGAMIAFLGEIIFDSLSSPRPPTQRKIDKINPILIYSPEELDKVDIMPRQRTDEVQVTWKN